MTDSTPRHGGPSDPLDPTSPLSIASAGLDGELSADEAGRVHDPEVETERRDIEAPTRIVRSSALPTPPPGLAERQIAIAMQHFESAATTSSAAGATIDLTERRAARTEARRELDQRNSRRMLLLSRAAAVIVVVGLLGGVLAVLNRTGSDDSESADATQVAAEADDAFAGGDADAASAVEESGAVAEAEEALTDEAALDSRAAEDGAQESSSPSADLAGSTFLVVPLPEGTPPPPGSLEWESEELYAFADLDAAAVALPELQLEGDLVVSPTARAICSSFFPPTATGVIPLAVDDRLLEYAVTTDGGSFAEGLAFDPANGCQPAELP